MYRIAVCDDSAESTAELTAQLGELSEELMLDAEIDTYPSYDKLRAAMQSVRYDLLCLESAIGQTSGLDFAHEVREAEIGTDRKVEILFVTENPKYALMAYSVFPTGYVLKPTAKKKLRHFFLHAVRKHVEAPTVILRRMEGGEVRVPIDDIFYIEVFERELDVHCREGVYVCYGSLAEVHGMLPARQFYRSHRSFIVNLKYVTKISEYQFTLKNDGKAAIAKNRYTEAKRILRAFVGEKNGRLEADENKEQPG